MHQPEDQTDAALLREFSASGDHSAFDTLVKRHGPMVHAVSMRVLSNHHDAQEVTQAAFMVLAREAAKLAGKPSVAGWLHTVSRRLALNARQSRQRRQRREQAAMNESTDVTPDATLGAGLRRELDAAIKRLPDQYRQPLILFHLEGASLKEISARLDLHPTTLRTRLSRAREALKQTLTRRGVEFASVGALTALITSESEAAALPSALHASVLDAATGGGARVSPRVLELAASKGLSIPATATTLTILLKTKAILIPAIVLAIGAIGTTAYVANQRDRGSAQGSPSTGGNPPAATRFPRQEPNLSGLSTTLENDPLSRISSEEEFQLLVESVLLITDDAGRLKAIRNRVGMGISDEVYRDAVAAVGFSVDPQRLFKQLVMAWVEEDPEAATLWARRVPGEFGDMVARRMVSIREQPAPEPSAQSAEQLRGLKEQLLAISGSGEKSSSAKAGLAGRIDVALSQWARRDPQAAAEFATTLDQDIRQQLSHMSFLIGEWARKDPDSALAWANGLEGEKERAGALVSVLPSWQLKHPDQTLDEAADLSIIPDDRFRMLIGKVVEDLATADPSRAMEYSLSLEDPESKRIMVGMTVESWARKAPAEARQAVEALPAGALRDTGLGRLSPRIAQTSFDDTSGLVREIGDAAIRQETIEMMLITSNALERHFPQALELVDELPQIDHMAVHGWTSKITSENVPAFRTWLEEAKAAGKIQFPTHPKPESVDPEELRSHNEASAAAAYGIVLEALEKAAERK